MEKVPRGVGVYFKPPDIKKLSNYHKPNDSPNIFIFSSPRSGSEWLMNIIASQPGIKHCSEIFNLRRPVNLTYIDHKRWFEYGQGHPETEEDFEYILHWFKNELPLDDSNADDPILVFKNPSKSYKGCTTGLDDDKGNTTWVSNRFASALEYARSQSKK